MFGMDQILRKYIKAHVSVISIAISKVGKLTCMKLTKSFQFSVEMITQKPEI